MWFVPITWISLPSTRAVACQLKVELHCGNRLIRYSNDFNLANDSVSIRPSLILRVPLKKAREELLVAAEQVLHPPLGLGQLGDRGDHQGSHRSVIPARRFHISIKPVCKCIGNLGKPGKSSRIIWSATASYQQFPSSLEKQFVQPSLSLSTWWVV